MPSALTIPVRPGPLQPEKGKPYHPATDWQPRTVLAKRSGVLGWMLWILHGYEMEDGGEFVGALRSSRFL